MKTSDERTQSIKSKVAVKRRKRTVIFTSTATACVLIALTVICSLPILGQDVPPIKPYAKDDYFPIIEKINARYQDDKHSIFESLGNLGMVGDAATAPPSLSGPTSDSAGSITSQGGVSGESGGNKYEETTLNQVDGVIEGDLLKRSTTHAFHLKTIYRPYVEKYLQLHVYKLAGNDTKVVSEYNIRAKDGTSFLHHRGHINSEMFINADATRLTIIFLCLNEQNAFCTTVVSLDISDVSAITEVNRVYVSGSYLSSRLVNGKLLVITNFDVGYNGGGIDYDKKETYIPQCGSAPNVDFIPMKDIYVPDNCQSVNYTVLAMLDETTLNVDDSHAVFSYSQDVYVSRDYIVVARNSRYYYANQFDYGNELSSDKADAQKSAKQIMTCEMVAFKYGDGITNLGEIGVEGCIKDRYSMDEKDGILRVFTTTRRKPNPFFLEDKNSLNVNLYCVNLNTMKVVASKEQFAPAGDEVKSARFDGDYAYVCTARGVIDPVFYFDLSDLNNITYRDTGEIGGFSVNLIKFNDLLLGIGRGENAGLKVELYKETDDDSAANGVQSVAVYERDCLFSVEYKAHFVNAEHNLIGLHIIDYGDMLITSNPNASLARYLLLRYDADTESLVQIYWEAFDCSSNALARAFYEHNGVYVFGTDDFTFIELQ